MGTETLDLKTSLGKAKLAHELRLNQLHCETAFKSGPRDPSYISHQERIEGQIEDAVAICNGDMRERRDLAAQINKTLDSYPKDRTRERFTLTGMLEAVRLPLDNMRSIESDYSKARSNPEKKLDIYVKLASALKYLGSQEHTRVHAMARYILGEACILRGGDLMGIINLLKLKQTKVTIDEMQEGIALYRLSGTRTFSQLFF